MERLKSAPSFYLYGQWEAFQNTCTFFLQERIAPEFFIARHFDASRKAQAERICVVKAEKDCAKKTHHFMRTFCATFTCAVSLPNLVRHLNTSCKSANYSTNARADFRAHKKIRAVSLPHFARHFVQTFRTVFIVAFRAKKSTEF